MFTRRASKINLNSEQQVQGQGQAPPPPQTQHPDVWSEETASSVTYFVRTPWDWVMKAIAVTGMTQVLTALDLPTELRAKLATPIATANAATPVTRRRRNAAKKFKGPATLKIEVTNPETGNVVYAVHGSSSALDGMEDKDELVRTIQRCRCDHMNLSPPSVLISWDVTSEECSNVVGKELPTLKENSSEKKYAVLKEPMGSQGKGIYFVTTAEEIHKVIEHHRVRALNEPDFLDNLIAVKGRIPSWVLQAEVNPPLLVKNRRKFHIRSYLVIMEKLNHPDIVDIFIFNRHEMRIAGISVPENDDERDPVSHITNGALSDLTERVLLHEEDELASRDLQKKTEVFVAETFGKHLLPDITRRVNLCAQQLAQEGDTNSSIRKFAIAGLDIMVTEDNKIFLLEVNSNPAAPREATIDDTFKEHLKGFMHSLVDLVTGNPSPNFVSAREILVREGIAE